MPKIEKDNEQCCLGEIAGNKDFSETADKADFYKRCRIAYFQSKTKKDCACNELQISPFLRLLNTT